MLQRLKAVVFMASSRRALMLRDPDRAMAYVERIERLRPLRTMETAFKATILIQQRKPRDADALLRDVISLTDGDQRPDQLYTNLFARELLAEATPDSLLAMRLAQQMKEVRCSSLTRRFLPPPKDNTVRTPR